MSALEKNHVLVATHTSVMFLMCNMTIKMVEKLPAASSSAVRAARSCGTKRVPPSGWGRVLAEKYTLLPWLCGYK